MLILLRHGYLNILKNEILKLTIFSSINAKCSGKFNKTTATTTKKIMRKVLNVVYYYRESWHFSNLLWKIFIVYNMKRIYKHKILRWQLRYYSAYCGVCDNNVIIIISGLVIYLCAVNSFDSQRFFFFFHFLCSFIFIINIFNLYNAHCSHNFLKRRFRCH